MPLHLLRLAATASSRRRGDHKLRKSAVLVLLLTIILPVWLPGGARGQDQQPKATGTQEERLAEENLVREREALRSTDPKKIEDSLCNGSYWVRLSRESKVAFINGFLDEILYYQLFCNTNTISKDEAPDTPNARSPEWLESYFFMDRIETIVDALDKEYALVERESKMSMKSLYDSVPMTVHVIVGTRWIATDMQKSMTKFSKIDPKVLEDPELGKRIEEAVKKSEEQMKKYRVEQPARKAEKERRQIETGYDKLASSDGFYWKSINRTSKFAYISGLLDGLLFGNQLCKAPLPGEDYLKKASGFFFYIKKVNDMVDAVDAIFVDVANRNLDIAFALYIQNGRTAGLFSSEEMEQLLRVTRQHHR